MGSLFTTLFDKIAKVVAWFGQLWVAIFKAAWHVITDGFCWALEQTFDIAGDTVEAINVGSLSTQAGVWGSIPANVLEVMAALGMGTALAIIVTAIGIRLVLQLIPFTRLGS